jgi:hypothetical protein
MSFLVIIAQSYGFFPYIYTMRTVRDIFNLPALILHELSHVIVSLLFGAYLNEISTRRHTKGHIVVVLNIIGLKGKMSVISVAMSPFLVPITFGLLSVVNPLFLIYFPYALCNFKTTFPSPTDFKVAGMSVPTIFEV